MECLRERSQKHKRSFHFLMSSTTSRMMKRRMRFRSAADVVWACQIRGRFSPSACSPARSVIEDEEIDAAERAQDAGVAAVAARQSEIGEQPRNALIEHGTIVAASPVVQRRRQATPDH